MNRSREKMVVSAIGQGETLNEATRDAIADGVSTKSKLVGADAFVKDGFYTVTLDFEIDFKWLDEGYTLGEIMDEIYVEEDEANLKADQARANLRVVGSLKEKPE